METSQMQADRLLAEDREARAALAAEHDVETAARAALAAIDREARERAAPYLDTLARIAAARPPLSIVIGGWTDRGRRWLQAGAPLGDAFAVWDQPPIDVLGDRFGVPPYSKADQVRNALLAAFADMEETVTTRARLRKLLAAASDRTLELVGRSLKHYQDR